MTAFTASQVPSAVNTLEKLVVWALLALKSCNPSDQLTLLGLDGSQSKQMLATNSHFDDANGIRRFYSQVYMEMDPAYDSDRSRKVWTFARDIGTVAIPAGYTSD